MTNRNNQNGCWTCITIITVKFRITCNNSRLIIIHRLQGWKGWVIDSRKWSINDISCTFLAISFYLYKDGHYKNQLIKTLTTAWHYNTVLVANIFFLLFQPPRKLGVECSSRQEVNWEKVLKILPMSIQSCIYTSKLSQTKTKLPVYSVHCTLESIWRLLAKQCPLFKN